MASVLLVLRRHCLVPALHAKVTAQYTLLHEGLQVMSDTKDAMHIAGNTDVAPVLNLYPFISIPMSSLSKLQDGGHEACWALRDSLDAVPLLGAGGVSSRGLWRLPQWFLALLDGPSLSGSCYSCLW